MALVYDNIRADYGENIATDLQVLAREQVATKRLDLLNPNKAAFMVFMKQLQKKPPVGDLTFTYHEDEQVKTSIKLAASHTAAATQITVDDATVLSPWMTLYNKDTQTSYLVEAIVSEAAGTVTVNAGYDGGTNAAGTAGQELIIRGHSLEEGTGVASAHWTEPNQYTNYITNTMESVSMTWHAMNADLHYDQKREAYEFMKAVLRHNERLDLKLMFNGKPLAPTASTTLSVTTNLAFPTEKGNSLSDTMGYLYWHRTYADAEHYKTVPTLTENGFIDLLEAAFSAERGHGSERKVILMPRNAISGLLKWNIGRTRFTKVKDGSMPLGLKFTRIEAASHGIVDIVRYDPFYSQSTAGGAHLMTIIDRDRIGYTTYKGMDTRIERDVIKTGDQVRAGYVFSAIGSVFLHPNVHATAEFNAIG